MSKTAAILILFGITIGSVGCCFILRPTAVYFPIWVIVLITYLVSGAAGGVLGVFSLFDIKQLLSEKEDDESLLGVSSRSLFGASIVGMLGGIGGAIAILSVMLIDGKIPSANEIPRRHAHIPLSSDNKIEIKDGRVSFEVADITEASDVKIPDDKMLLMVTSGVVAGFLGFRLLRRVSSKLDEHVQQSLDSIKRDMKFSHIMIALQEAADFGQKALAGGPRESNDALAVKKLKKVVAASEKYTSKGKLKPGTVNHSTFVLLNRRAFITLARLVDEKLNDRSVAIDALSHGLEVLSKIKISTDEDRIHQGGLLYNRAFYKIMLGQLDSGFEDLAESCKLDEKNKDEARKDKDFESVWSNPKFIAIVGSVQEKLEEVKPAKAVTETEKATTATVATGAETATPAKATEVKKDG